jgi:hypothetical protein
VPDTFVKIASVTVGSGGASSIDFTSIPSTYTDLVLKYSLRGSGTAVNQTCYVQFNNDTGANYSSKYLYGDGSTANSASSSSYTFIGSANDGGSTASTFNNGEFYIPNYAGSTQKSLSVDIVRENNAASTYATTTLYADLWTGTAAISSFKLYILAGNFVQYSSATLYGIKNS